MAYISFQPSDYFKAHLYTGTGASNAQTFPETAAMKPDLTWIKNRDAADFNVLTDSIRGVTKYMQSNSTAAEVTNAESLKSFDSDGFTVGTQAEVNTNTEDFVSWNWKAGTTTGIDTTGSTITPSSYSFNATSGFSVIAYTGNSTAGALVPHGLGVTPKMIIVKKVDGTDGWGVYHSGMDATAPEDYYAFLDSTAARVDSTMWNDTAPTSILFSLGSGGDVNSSSSTYIAYCFADVKGYSKFESYQGNGNANGSFTYTGFRPGFLMIKRINTGGQWMIFDDKRLGYNERNYDFQASNSNAERTTGPWMDILSNGFKIRSTDTDFNGGGDTMVYAAFAAFPTVSSNNLPGVAR